MIFNLTKKQLFTNYFFNQLITFSEFNLTALICKDKDGDESGSAVAHDKYEA